MSCQLWQWSIRTILIASVCGASSACLVSSDVEEWDDLDEAVGSTEEALTSSDLSKLVLGGVYPVTQGYLPNGVHAGIDFGSTGDGVTSVKSPVNGTITANTSTCGKVAVFDGSNTIIMAHMTSRTTLAVGSTVTVGTYLGKASMVVGGGCTATGAHLHMEIRTGSNTSMALPTANNTTTTRDPLSYMYGAFPPVSLLSPANGTYASTNPVTFSWSAVQGANSYRLQISSTNSFDSETCLAGCFYNLASSTTSRSVTLTTGKTYYWRVRAGNSSTGQGGYWSPVRSVSK